MKEWTCGTAKEQTAGGVGGARQQDNGSHDRSERQGRSGQRY